MDSKLIDLFREKVNNNGADLILHRYRNNNGKNQWSIICSAMDWISVVVGEIDVRKLSKKNNNDSSIRVMTFIVCIDVLWEAIQQLHRVLLNTENIPFVNEKSVFQHKKFETTDNKYFKTIRACFATHPVNLKDDFSGEKKVEQRYAGWSGGGFGKGDFSVILYSNQPDKNPEFLDIYFSELLRFAEQRYAYLSNLMDEIDRQTVDYCNEWKNKRIRRVNSVVEQIEILIHESKVRLDNDYYNFALEELRLIYTVEIHSMQNKKLVEKYRIALIEKVNEIFALLQDMSLKDWRRVTMGDKKIYIVAKIFDQQGCLAYLCKTPNEARCLPGTLEALRADGVQIVILDSPEIYSEYAPYTYIEDMKEFIDKVAQMNRVA